MRDTPIFRTPAGKSHEAPEMGRDGKTIVWALQSVNFQMEQGGVVGTGSVRLG